MELNMEMKKKKRHEKKRSPKGDWLDRCADRHTVAAASLQAKGERRYSSERGDRLEG